MTVSNSTRPVQSDLETNTKANPFDYGPVTGSHLFCVPAGVDPISAASKAWALEAAVKDILESGVERGLDVNLAFLCEHAMNAAIALREAVVKSPAGADVALEYSVRDAFSASLQNGMDGNLSFLCKHAMASALASMEARGELP